MSLLALVFVLVILSVILLISLSKVLGDIFLDEGCNKSASLFLGAPVVFIIIAVLSYSINSFSEYRIVQYMNNEIQVDTVSMSPKGKIIEIEIKSQKK